jgi:hypothetical protein
MRRAACGHRPRLARRARQGWPPPPGDLSDFVRIEITLAFGVPINEFTFGTTLILAGTIALAGGLVAIGLAANRSMAWWLLALGQSAAGLIVLGFGVPIKEFSLGNTLIVAGTILLTAGLVALGHAANRSMVPR